MLVFEVTYGEEVHIHIPVTAVAHLTKLFIIKMCVLGDRCSKNNGYQVSVAQLARHSTHNCLILSCHVTGKPGGSIVHE